ATDNRVILKGSPTLDGRLIGGRAGNAGGTSSGNVLEVHSAGLSAKNVEDFQHYHFILPADIADGDVVLTLTDSNGTDLEDAEVGVAIEQGSNVLAKGDKVALIRNAGGVDTSGVTQTTLTGYQGISLQYDFTLENDNGDDLTDSSGNDNLY